MSQGIIGEDLPISYASTTLGNAEMNYTTTEKFCSETESNFETDKEWNERERENPVL